MERRYVRVLARYFYWPRLSEGSRYKKKGKKNARVAERAGAKSVEAREKERTESVE